MCPFISFPLFRPVFKTSFVTLEWFAVKGILLQIQLSFSVDGVLMRSSEGNHAHQQNAKL